MVNKNYQRGKDFENEVVKIFKEAGFEAQRTAGSHGTFDVILIKYTREIQHSENLM